MRHIPVAKTVGLSILTLGVYGGIWAYRCAEDLHHDHQGFKHWRLFFWLGFLTFGITWGWLAIRNFVRVNRMRAAIGIPPHRDGVWAMILAFIPILNILGAVLWAQYWNHTRDILTAAR